MFHPCSICRFTCFAVLFVLGLPGAGYPDAPLSEVWADFLWAAIEREGTEANPFNSLEEAVSHVADGGTIWAKPGASSETPRVTKALRLNAAGGAALIGDPDAPPIAAPTITSSPQPQIKGLGDDAQFAVEASGGAPLAYQWRLNGDDLSDGGGISGAKGSVLNLTGVALENAGEYSCLVENCAGSAASDAAELAFDYIPVGPEESIQTALDAAADGGVVEVWPGTYAENLVFPGRDVILRSTAPEDEDTIASTILDGARAGPVIVFSGEETEACVVEGFTLWNGTGVPVDDAVYGGAIWGNGSMATIRNNTFLYNTAFGEGVAGYGGAAAGCAGLIENNIFAHNYADYGGVLHGCDGAIRDNIFRLNEAIESGGALHACSGSVRNCVISFNRSRHTGGGLASCAGLIQNNTVWGNRAEAGGGVFGCLDATIQNCILWANEAPIFAQIDGAGSAMPDYCCIEDWPGGGTGNIRPGQGPQLRLPEAGFFRLSPSSPCINAGVTIAGLSADMELDPRGGGDAFDIGADEYVAEAAPLAAPQNFLADTWDRLYDPPYNWDDVVHLEWDAVAGDVDSYGIFLATRPGGPYHYVARTTNTSADFMLDPGPLYYWFIVPYKIIPSGPPTIWDPHNSHSHNRDYWEELYEPLGFCSANASASPMRTVVLDPGHGGQLEHGAQRTYAGWTFYTYGGETVTESMLTHGLVWGWGSPYDPPQYKIHKGIFDFLLFKKQDDDINNDGQFRLRFKFTRPNVHDLNWKPDGAQRTPLEYRALYARNWKSLCFLSIHFNSGSSVNNDMLGLLYPVDTDTPLPYTETVSGTTLKYLISENVRQYFKDYELSSPNSWGMKDQWNLEMDKSFAEPIIRAAHTVTAAAVPSVTAKIWENAIDYGGMDKGHFRNLRDRLLWRRMDTEDGVVDGEIEYFDDQWTWDFVESHLEDYGFSEDTIFTEGIARQMPGMILEVFFIENDAIFEPWCALSHNPGGHAALIEGVASALADAIWEYAKGIE